MTKTAGSTTGRNTPSATGERRGARSTAAATSRESGEVAQAVERDLAKLPEDLATSGLAALCLALAREIDNPNSATSKSMCARALLDAQIILRELTPTEEEQDDLDDLAARRSARLSRGATA